MNKFIVIIAIGLALLVSSCAVNMNSPVMGGLYTDVKAPLKFDVSNDVSATKVGTATCKSILGAVAIGDAGVDAACKEAGIKKIHHVDYQSTNILSFYATYTILVYGE
jgi:hypothetical protein